MAIVRPLPFLFRGDLSLEFDIHSYFVPRITKFSVLIFINVCWPVDAFKPVRQAGLDHTYPFILADFDAPKVFVFRASGSIDIMEL